jgi:hypothetical protein
MSKWTLDACSGLILYYLHQMTKRKVEKLQEELKGAKAPGVA